MRTGPPPAGSVTIRDLASGPAPAILSAMRFPSILAALALLSTPLPAKEAPAGLSHELVVRTQPRPVRIHVLKLDLRASPLRLKVALAPDPDGDGPAEAALTDPFRLAKSPGVVAFINTNPWRGLPGPDGKRDSKWRAGQPVDILGLAKSGGIPRSPATENTSAAISILPDGKVCIGAEAADAVEGLAGFSPVVSHGQPVPSQEPALHPRSALGTNADQSIVWLVVADGRQKGVSEGLNLTELGAFMAGLGCAEAVNLDGGGSSILALADASGTLKTLNSPSGRIGPKVIVRPVPCILTVTAE